MKIEDFKKIVETLQQVEEKQQEFYDLGIDVVSGMLLSPFYSVIDTLLEEIYGKDGAEWIHWALYENDFFRGGLEAKDED